MLIPQHNTPLKGLVAAPTGFHAKGIPSIQHIGFSVGAGAHVAVKALRHACCKLGGTLAHARSKLAHLGACVVRCMYCVRACMCVCACTCACAYAPARI
eukprot:1142841-Pelagomonas_calceolata.AAC.3